MSNKTTLVWSICLVVLVANGALAEYCNSYTPCQGYGIKTCCNNECVYSSSCEGRYCSSDYDCNSNGNFLNCCSNSCQWDYCYNPIPAIIGGTIAAIVVIIAIIVGVSYFCCCRRPVRATGGRVITAPQQQIITTTTTSNYPPPPMPSAQGPYQAPLGTYQGPAPPYPQLPGYGPPLQGDYPGGYVAGGAQPPMQYQSPMGMDNLGASVPQPPPYSQANQEQTKMP
ncbi:uncharacterized protein LOC116604613 [Nematostella vectensis]|uniref:uncharacterized protein LOC116604613 n=1 Tax=Nematostella vectensis TaxID=45351 RepID=UPI00207772F3|nr:uncharacterized protein LOC116604613 [Nematostella vectensis]